MLILKYEFAFFALSFGLQVGNEPIDYSSEVYADILLGMARGAKAADPAMRVLPGVLYPVDNFLKAVNRTHFEWLDGINVHGFVQPTNVIATVTVTVTVILCAYLCPL